MASFSETSFDAAGYSSARPSYPAALYSYINECTLSSSPSSNSDQGSRICVDLGCGPGLSTFGFLPFFDQIIGVEPGESMVKVARSLLAQQSGQVREKVRFESCSAEDLSGILTKENQDLEGKVDLVVACTSAHWFRDQAAVYHEISRILKPGGSFFFFTYSTLHFPNNPQFESLLPIFNEEMLGPYWSEPGHHISETLLASYPLPYRSNFPDQSEHSEFDEKTFKRSFFLRDETTPLPDLIPNEVVEEGLQIDRFNYSLGDNDRFLKRNWNLNQVTNLLNTWSAAHSWNKAHPGRDCAREFGEKLREAGWSDEMEEVQVIWEIGTLFGRKK